MEGKGISWLSKDRHRQTLYLQSFGPTPAFVSFLVQPYPCLLFLFSLSKYLLSNPALRKSVSSIRCWIWERVLATHLAQRLGEFLLFLPKSDTTKGVRRIEPFIASHTHVHSLAISLSLSLSHTHTHTHTHARTHTPIIKGERSSPPSLFASSKSP